MDAREQSAALKPGIDSLEVEGLRFGYRGKKVLEGLTAQWRGGELVAIVGPNGCGKSTLLKLLIGALVPQGGSVRFDGKPARTLGRIGMARRIAMVPQMAGGAGESGGLSGGGYSVEQTVLMARYAAHVAESTGILKAAGGWGIMGFETARDMQIAQTAMWNADVHHLAQRDVETLSGGERQRVAIARAFAQETPVLLLDEPTSSLDLFHQLELLEQLRAQTRAGNLVILVTHDLNLAAACATRVLVMDNGTLVADGTPAQVLVPEVLEPVYHVKVLLGTDRLLHFQRRETK